MGRVTTVGPWSHSSDEDFRAWVQEVEYLMDAAGLVRTADTGQMDSSTITRPGSNYTYPYYAMWRFNDPLQATAPIFIRLNFGRSSGITHPGMTLQVGTGTDGAGTLVGARMLETAPTGQSVPGSSPDYVSRAVHLPGFAALSFKLGAISSFVASSVAFVIQRTVDNTGSPTPEGFVVNHFDGAMNNSSTLYSRFSLVRFTDPLPRASMSSSNLGWAPSSLTDSRVGLSPQAFLHWAFLPKQSPLIGTCGFLRGEVPVGAEFQLPLVGTTPRNYICLGDAFGNVLNHANNSDIAILWEDD